MKLNNSEQEILEFSGFLMIIIQNKCFNRNIFLKL